MSEEREAAKEQFVEQNLMQDPNFLQQVQGMEPEARAQYIDQLFRDYNGEGQMAGDELTMAADLLNTPSAEGRQAGRTYVAANPLEHIASAANRIKGGNDRDAAMSKRQELSDSRSAGLRQTGELMSQMPAVATDPTTGLQSVNDGAKMEFQKRMADKLAQEQAFGGMRT
tara:strand:+ start:4647 stop:5156 length:510 start_codon:yes stop_codon:yes gene_type:complete